MYLIYRGELEVLAGDFNTSIEFFEKGRLFAPDDEGGLFESPVKFTVSAWQRQTHYGLALLFAYRKIGEHEKAETISRQLEHFFYTERQERTQVSELATFYWLYSEAQFDTIEGRTTEALDKLRNWMGHGIIFTYISWDPFLESLRGNPEFEAIVAQVEAELAAVRAQYHIGQAKSEEAVDGDSA